MIAEVEKKIEGTLIEKLEAEVARLTQELEAVGEDKERATFDREYAKQEIDKLKTVPFLVVEKSEPKQAKKNVCRI